MRIVLGCALSAALAMSHPGVAAVTTTVVDTPTPRGVTQRFLYVRPDAPRANLVSIPGANGILGIQDDGSMSVPTARCGPVTRNRLAFADRGIAVALVDRASDGRVYRLDDMKEVVRYMSARDPVPTWIIGGSNSTEAIALLAAALPAADPIGVIFFSPQNLFASQAAAIRRPTGIVYHTGDPFQFGANVFQALTAATVKELMPINAGADIDCGYHLFHGADAEFIAAAAGFIDRHNASLAAAEANYQGLWWNPSESGWGVNLAHQGEQIYLTWYTYDATGKALWLAMLASKTAPGSYAGDILEVHGPPYSAVPFAPPPSASVVGNGTLTFSDASNGTFAYTAKGATQSKAIARFVFGAQPTCSHAAAPNFAAATNYQDLWWNAAKSGWGINLAHQGSQIYATWYTYDVDRSPLWLASLMTAGAAGTYTGALLRFNGPAFSTVPYPPSAAPVTVGNATLTFSNGNAANWSYTIGSTSGTEPMSRFLFAEPAGTVCH